MNIQTWAGLKKGDSIRSKRTGMTFQIGGKLIVQPGKDDKGEVIPPFVCFVATATVFVAAKQAEDYDLVAFSVDDSTFKVSG
jgi:hypothetical protein